VAIGRGRRTGQARVHGDVEGRPASVRELVFALVRHIPSGRVMTYGQISHLLAGRLSPVAVGWMLHRCPEELPWQRVVNASGGCSTDRLPDMPQGLQRALLEAEGIEFSKAGTVDLERYLWWPPGRAGAGL
jgi:methylated-DNA-protein-cysteine methyltransferase related protein